MSEWETARLIETAFRELHQFISETASLPFSIERAQEQARLENRLTMLLAVLDIEMERVQKSAHPKHTPT